MKHFLLSAFHLKAEGMLIAVLFYALWMTYCDNLGPNEKILHCSQQMLLGTCLAGKTLKELYPTLMHDTCIAHLLHNCAI